MTEHTPGPWTYEKCRCGHRACKQFTMSNQGSVGFDEPDARLIAAAPDMLAALRRMVALYDSSPRFLKPAGMPEVAKERQQALAQGEAALLKATG